MGEQPSVRGDGFCCDCGVKPAETNDKRFCKKCLRRRIRDNNPITKVFNDQRGRNARSSAVLGGSPDTRVTDDQD